jgi:superfamily I DNA/RNA helicase
MLLVSNRSGLRARNKVGQPIYWGEDQFSMHYFDSRHQIYSDKLSKLVIRCNEKSCGNVVDRISRVFRHIFVDEVQDLAGYDLDILVEFFKSSARILLVSDPRQVTYLTHHEAKYGKYADGRLVQFLKEKLPKKLPIEIDAETLNTSHRNSAAICSLASKLYPDMKPSTACTCKKCRSEGPAGAGIFIVRRADYVRYVETYRPMQLRDKVTSSGVDPRFPVMNFGKSKGCGFDRVVILPTREMLKWIRNVDQELKAQTRAKFYVALTRARYSVALVADWCDDDIPVGFSLFV